MKLAAILIFCLGQLGAAEVFESHPPMRPLPVPQQTHIPSDAHVVDATRGSDTSTGTEVAPWKTLQHALSKVSQGVIALRGGVFYSHAIVTTLVSKEQPLIICSWPGELVILDGGEPEFASSPGTAWVPCPGGVNGEFRSVKAYPLTKPASSEEDGDGEVLVMGRFIDSMIPLHGARFRGDLQSDNPWWNITSKSADNSFVSCGPAVWQDGRSGHIHCRLTHTRLPGLGEDNYRGITDVQKTQLCIATAAAGPVLTLKGARHVTLRGLSIRGSAVATLFIENCADVTLDNVTVYGGAKAIQIKDTAGFRMVNSACRGVSAPWMYRGALKYRSVEARLLSATSWMPSGVDSSDFEIAYSEFTDSEDGVFLGCVRGLRFHHNLVDNMTDDGIFLTASTGWDGKVAGGDVKLWQNRISRCLTSLAFGVGHGRQITLPDRVQTGDGLWITRNVFDFRRPVHYHWPKDAQSIQEPYFRGRFAGDHGSPAWEPMWVYHNTIVGSHVERPDWGSPGLGVGMGKGTTRHVLNNILCSDIGETGVTMPKEAERFHAQGNVLWSFDPAKQDVAAWKTKMTSSSASAAATNHLINPSFAKYESDWKSDVDLTPSLSMEGVAVPQDWFDPLKGKGIGAVSTGEEPWRIGIHGRLDVFGRAVASNGPAPSFEWTFTDDHPNHSPRTGAAKALSLQGYPAFDAPIFEYLLRRSGAIVESHEKEFIPLTPALLKDKKWLVIDGSFTRAKMTPDVFGESDISALSDWLENGGTLVLGPQRTDVFKSDAGKTFLSRHFGTPPRSKLEAPVILQPKHPWLTHLEGDSPAWLAKGQPIAAALGESIIGSGGNFSLLWQTKIGRGRIVCIGWSVGGQLSDNRRGGEVETDRAMLEQVELLRRILTLE